MSNRHPSITSVRLGVIGPTDLVARILDLGAGIPALNLTGRTYDDEQSAPDLLRSLLPEMDAVLFTGPVPYRLALAQVLPPVPLPVMYVPLKGTGLYRTLYHARPAIDLERVSMDTLTQGEVEETYHELGLAATQVQCLDDRGSLDRTALTRFHLECYRAGKTSAALTGLYSAHLELQRVGVPSFWITPTTADLKGALDRAVLLGVNQRQGQVVVGLVSIANGQPTISDHELHLIRHEIHGLLLRFVEQFDGYLFAPGANEYQFFATREPFERSTGSLTQTPFLEEICRLAGAKVSMGVGIGRTANQAGSHARIALHPAQEAKGNVAYVVLENRRLVGPVGSGAAAVASDLRSVNPDLLLIARASGMSAPLLDRLLASLEPTPTFTAADVAAILNIGLRSAHRNLARLEQAAAVEVIGQEKLTTPGRPRAVYQITPGVVAATQKVLSRGAE
jgi:hypothetical protein